MGLIHYSGGLHACGYPSDGLNNELRGCCLRGWNDGLSNMVCCLGSKELPGTPNR